MKILRLSFKNLNSLAGVWEIDFTHPDYVSSGIFAITGPTGAGKSTILDAICLALYGQTPRLGRITQSENEIMSRQSGECFSEVVFETAKGSFCCHWSQHRSRKQADGQLQSPKHEIAEAASGQILESKLRAVADKVEEVTGMDFDRFTRSMLLAQGGFAAFLQARPDERAPILEQITGTAIYSRISIKVHERTAQERARLTELRGELEGIQLLSPAEAEALQLEQAELQRMDVTLTEEVRLLREAHAWRERIGALEGELRQLDQDRLSFEVRKTAAGPELELLALASQALKLSGEHAQLRSMRTQQVEEQGQLKGARERFPQLQAEWQSAFDALELAESGVIRTQGEQAREAELIRETRALDIRLGEAQAHLRTLTDEIEHTARQESAYRLVLAECDRRIGASDDELREIAAFLGEHQVDAGLSESLTGIEEQLKGVTSLAGHSRQIQARLAQQAGVIEKAGRALGEAEDVWQRAHENVSGAQQRCDTLRAAGAALLQGDELTAWRREAERVATRQRRLGEIQEGLIRLEGLRPRVAGLQERGNGLELQCRALLDQERALAGESELREQIARGMQENVVLLNRVRDLEQDRLQLVDGAPCPLCGAVEHPYAAGNIPQLDQAQQKLALALTEAKQVGEQLSRIRLEQVKVDKDLQQLRQELSELGERQLCDESFCANALLELGLAADVTAWGDIICRESESCQDQLHKRRAVIQQAEQLEQEERSAQAALQKLKDQLAGHDQARLTARLGHAAALAEAGRLEGERATLRADLDRAVATLGEGVACYGCRAIDADRANDVLIELRERRNAYVRHVQAKDGLEKKRAESVAERETQRALVAESEKSRSDKEQRLTEHGAQRDALVEQRLELYGERNPDVEEKRLADTLRLAVERREAALQLHHRLKGELDQLQGQIERLTHSLAQRGGQLAEREAAFCLHLLELGFGDESSFGQACLPGERFDALTRLVDALRSEETALATRHQDRSQALAGELNRNLTEKPLDLIQEENAALSARLNELHKALGALEERLRQHAEQQTLHQTRLQEIEVQQQECQRWERLHSLIGSGDGKRFRNFAQGLTFELMVAHANRQLQKMSDRYILLRDDQEPLELNVIDNYQAGEIRSTKNLSGGESFIASLALSLGLSSMSSRNVRVDSLFLDEGFGTLDEDALETALETLSGLQQDGKLIGIISHVPALKERIGTQIQVESGSGGRSTLGGPGCRRIV